MYPTDFAADGTNYDETLFHEVTHAYYESPNPSNPSEPLLAASGTAAATVAGYGVSFDLNFVIGPNGVHQLSEDYGRYEHLNIHNAEVSVFGSDADALQEALDGATSPGHGIISTAQSQQAAANSQNDKTKYAGTIAPPAIPATSLRCSSGTTTQSYSPPQYEQYNNQPVP